MNELLKRQLRKYLPEDLKEREDLQAFLQAVSASYDNLEDQFKMTQRAMKLSSDELYEVNVSLRQEAEKQRALLSRFEEVVNRVAPPTGAPLQDGKNLSDYISQQAEELIALTQRQEGLLQELEQQNQELSDYAHIVSHDLKSPLRNIDALVSWLREDYADVLDENGLQQMDLIKTHLGKMDALIGGILHYSTIGRDSGTESKIDLNVLLPDILDGIQIPEGIDVQVHRLPVITADRFKIQQVFQNLICNAVTSIEQPSGKIKVVSRELDKGHQFEISDTGKGIDSNYFDKIFKVFQKLEHDSATTGIGLSIVKKIVNFYGGSIWLDSEPGKGTTFYFTLPQTEK
ncbi:MULTISPECIES: ATP-binding protein [unclassified Leeuwenhoekiella]|uniref:sensor histidine kinase n=1 Tax=unclassified Leeuwenhoekiella TaxID=2615029 RepID=UPI000C4B37B9|nr:MULTISPECIES: ATP-binding protein [unclassified Leeuwenhoekiella]MAW97029.1 two-component sensor histidine kinase [Leeuwenhoekiella sp.]MBA80690.1 two-component sensor histidine kinase [Leeuwenhoekiella sp.]